MVDQSLRRIASRRSEDFLICFGRDWVWIVCEEISEVEGEWRGFVDGYGAARFERLAAKLATAITYRRVVAVESAIECAKLKFGDLTSIAPPLISSARCECEGEVASRATPPSISVSDMVWSAQCSRRAEGEVLQTKFPPT